MLRDRKALVAIVLVFAAIAAAATSSSSAKTTDHRGGTLKLLAKAAGGTLDPQVNYTLQYWQLYQATYDGLLALPEGRRRRGVQRRPRSRVGLQASERRQDLDVHAAQGDQVLERPGADRQRRRRVLQAHLQGEEPDRRRLLLRHRRRCACLKTPATCTLKGGISGNAANNTVTINLTAPDPEFKYKLAVPHASILPASAPPNDAGTKLIPSTGAYYFASYNPNKQLVMKRNPYFKQWSKDAQPDGYPDQITQSFGLTVESQITAIENGQADWTLEAPPADRLNELGTKYASQTHVETLTAFWYAPMNVNLAPFNNLKARQAVNYAIDRNAAGQDLRRPEARRAVVPGPAAGLPGQQALLPVHEEPRHDVVGARCREGEEARPGVRHEGHEGHRDLAGRRGAEGRRRLPGRAFSTRSASRPPSKTISGNIAFTYVQNTKNKVQINVQQWYQDYPAASDFLHILFGCESFHPGSDSSINIAGFCDKKINAQMHEALKLEQTDFPGANALWAKIDRQVTDASPMATLFTPRHIDFLSKRVGNFMFSKQFYWLVDQSWVQ